jgi:hypothetical protein
MSSGTAGVWGRRFLRIVLKLLMLEQAVHGSCN